MEHHTQGDHGNGGGSIRLTVGSAIVQAAHLLNERGIGEPREHAERLMMHLLGADRARLLRDWGEALPDADTAAWQALVDRKGNGEPLQYIVGEQWFYELAYTVTPAVLIPRPETELLVEAVLAAADRLWPQAAVDSPPGAAPDAGGGAAGGEPGPTVLDVGTGSGAIGVTLAALRPRWRVVASDLSPDALEVARTNATRHGAAPRMAFVQGDLLAPFAARREDGADASGGDGHAGLRIDVLVSNPPYIPARDIEDLQIEVRGFEPRLALDGGEDGLNPYRIIVSQLPKLAQLPRIVAFELGIGQAEAVADLLRQLGHWSDIRIIRDYGGIDRHVIATAP
ncbi:release factor glutamine methyltransferase [Paenibacillus phyllosphaerae]|uniref:Release factor glutamine methyltransferase n=1 Tax=Paenibacillus phyllosphaerae TaxID=274593 RepID=A0A7W5AXK3_9BACL|nr:peptide chain release factor N(5)-glutamine methyltransferase [Paenibacillus phyllosphaerae]MBB3110603.1 release factor glutamine methyltransferase [Paenibacillus phyllosphaerae]